MVKADFQHERGVDFSNRGSMMLWTRRRAGRHGEGTLLAALLCLSLCAACSDESTPADGGTTPDQATADGGGPKDGAPEANKPNEAGADGPVVTPDRGPKPDQAPKLPAHWKLVASKIPEMTDHTATLLTGGQVLIVGGSALVAGNDVYSNKAHLYLPMQGVFAASGTLTDARAEHVAARLNDGRVLVAGGTNDKAYLGSAEIYDPKKPAAAAWSKAKDMFEHRAWGHAAVTLKNGRVLVTGGFVSSDSTSSVTLYDPTQDKWLTPAAQMNVARRGHTMTLLQNGKVVIAGGVKQGTNMWSYETTDTVEVYDPSSGTFTLAQDKMAKGRTGHTATLMKDGRVLIVGGVCWDGKVKACANAQQKDDIFDPVSGKLTHIAHPGSAGGLPSAHISVLLDDGRVMVAGSNDDSTADTVVAFAPGGGGIWDTLPAMKIGRWSATATKLKDGSVLVVGGVHTSTPSYTYASAAELFVP